MSLLRALRTKGFAALMLVGAVCTAALFAHVGIDVAGDALLAHDTYDGLDHHSRSDACALALTLAIGALLRVAWLALDEAQTGRRTHHRTLDDVFGPGPWRFAGTVVALTLPALTTMELADVVADGRRFDGVADLLGGSCWLGLTIATPVAAFVGLAVWWIAGLVRGSHRALVTVFGLLLALLPPSCPSAGARSCAPVCGSSLRLRSVLSRRSGKRGPPRAA
jgi:hypothetical protein